MCYNLFIEIEFIILIAVGTLLVVSTIVYFIMFFCFNKWIMKNNKPIRVIRLGHKKGKVRLYRMDWECELRDEEEIFDHKGDAKQ